jgi:hypothetical protein
MEAQKLTDPTDPDRHPDPKNSELSSEVKFPDPEFGPSPFCNNHLDLFRKMPNLLSLAYIEN